MKNKGLLAVMVVMLVASISAAGDVVDLEAKDPNDGLTVWAMTADGADHAVSVLLGYTENKIEFGGMVRYWEWGPKWGPQPDAAGLYFAFHVGEIAGITDQLPDSGWEEFLHSMIARPYLRVEGLIPLKGDQRTPKLNYIAGTLISTDPSFKQSIAVELATGQGISTETESVLSIGARLRW